MHTARLMLILTAIWSVAGCSTLSALTDQPAEKTCPRPSQASVIKLEHGQRAPETGYFLPAADMREFMHYLVGLEAASGCIRE